MAKELFFVCYACSQRLPISLRNKHHKIPQAAGGGDKDIVDLCLSDHHALHAVANIIRNPKRGLELEPILATFKENKDHRTRILELASLVNKYMLLKADNMLDLGDDLKMITFEIPAKLYSGLVMLAKDRKLSISDYCKILIQNKVLNEYPALKS